MIHEIERMVERKMDEGRIVIASLALAGLMVFLVLAANFAEALLK